MNHALPSTSRNYVQSVSNLIHSSYNATMMSTTNNDSFPIRKCNSCGNVLIFTYTCHSKEEMRDFTAKLPSGWSFICRACRSIQVMQANEIVCTRGQVIKLLNTRESRLNHILPEHPRPRSYGNAGKITEEDLIPIMNQP